MRRLVPLLLAAVIMPATANASPIESLAIALSLDPHFTATPAGWAPGTAGMRIERDPDSGEWRMPEFAASVMWDPLALDRSSEGLTVIVLPDGSKMVDLQGRFEEYFTVTLGADGRFHPACFSSARVARTHVLAPTAPAVEWAAE